MSNYQSFNETKKCFDDKKEHWIGFEMTEQNTLFFQICGSTKYFSLSTSTSVTKNEACVVYNYVNAVLVDCDLYLNTKN